MGEPTFWNSVKWISTWETMEARKYFDFTSVEVRLLEGRLRARLLNWKRKRFLGAALLIMKFNLEFEIPILDFLKIEFLRNQSFLFSPK